MASPYSVRVVNSGLIVEALFDTLENATTCFEKHIITLTKYNLPVCVRMTKKENDKVVVIREIFPN